MRIVVDKGVEVAMRDGVVLATDVYRPDGDGRWPVLVQRLPYDKELPKLTHASLDLMRAVQAGFAIVVQDTRGRFQSGGDFNPFFKEGADGADTIAWAAAQPWSTGRVGMFGSSYFGATQWLAATETPPALEAIAPYLSSIDYRRWMHYGGAFELGFVLCWTLLFLALGDATRRLRAGQDVLAEVGALVAAVDANDEWFRRLPLADNPLLEAAAPYFREWLDHPAPDAYWSRAAVDVTRITAPALVIGGWFDLFLGGTLASFSAVRDGGASSLARRPRLVIGPWAHGNDTAFFPESGFGLMASADGADLTAVQLEFFRDRLTGDAGVLDRPPVRLFVMGAGEWRDFADWPPPQARASRWFLRAGGELSRDAPGPDEAPDELRYDPGDPVPTCGGATFLPGLAVSANAGPRDQAPLDDRSDVLRFVSAPLEDDLEVVGPVELVLHVASSARDTDMTGKLIDVYPDGRAIALTDGIVRARFRESLTNPQWLEPGEVVELRVDVGATANRFHAGHRIRADVSSSNFPRFDANTNTGGPIGHETEADFVVATNRVFHDAARPSYLVLTVLEAT